MNNRQQGRFGRGSLTAGLLLAAALSGCGGGGGDTGPSTNPQQSTEVPLTAQNYEAIGHAVVSSSMFLTDSTGWVTGAEVATQAPLIAVARDQALRALRRAMPQATVVGAQTSEVVNCARAGSVAITINDANNNNQMDAGDSLTLEARGCNDGDGVISGTLQLSVVSTTGDLNGNNYSATVQMTMRGFSIVDGADRTQADGVLSLQLSETPAGVVEVAITVPSLVVDETVAGAARSVSLSNARLNSRTEGGGSAMRTTMTTSGNFGGTGFDGKSVAVTTPQPFVAIGSDAYPSSGQLLIRGANGSSLRLTALNAVQVRFELDADGNGSYEASLTRNWSSLH